MINPIFGDDGFRSLYGRKFMTKKFLKVFSYSLSNYMKKKKITKLVIGCDTRYSAKFIFDLFSKYIDIDIQLYYLEIVTLGELSYETKINKYQLALMITASHFHYSYNGIKLLDASGQKLSRDNEKIIEDYINLYLKNYKSNNFISYKRKIISTKSKIYSQYIYRSFRLPQKKRILIDCANGSASVFFNTFFKSKRVKLINNKPDGRNINLKCGAYYYNNKQFFNDYDYSIHFDGDADRVIFKTKKYGELSPEFLVFAFCYYNRFRFKNKTISSSEIVNSSLNSLLININYKLKLSKVGDRNVFEKMKQSNSILGFEPSGHYTFNNKINTMDGIYAFMKFLPIIDNDELINKCLKIFRLRKRIIISLNQSSNKKKISLNKINLKLNNLIYPSEEYILLRKSIWSSKFRLYYDFEKIDRSRYLIPIVKKYL